MLKHFLKTSIKGLTFFIFIVMISSLYGLCIQMNPIPPINIFLWIAFAFLIHKTLGTTINSKQRVKKTIGYMAILVSIYFAYLIKSTYYVAYFNDIYLLGSVSIIPDGFQDDLVSSILSPSVFIEKLNFFLLSDNTSLSFTNDFSFSLGTSLTNAIRFIEVLGILFSTLIWTKISSRTKS